MATAAAWATAATPGYSGTPLARKLGMKDGLHALTINAPADYLQWLEPLPARLVFDKRLGEATALVHLFTDSKAVLAQELKRLRTALRADGMVWISWPKKASKWPTDITEDSIREVALPLGFVDVKVCAVSDVWSGLKLVIRKELR